MPKIHAFRGAFISAFGTCAFLLLTGCAVKKTDYSQRNCPIGTQNWVKESLYFGREGEDTGKWEKKFNQFLTETVTPRFPQGFSVIPLQGQWQGQGQKGKIIREPSKMLLILHADTASENQKIAFIAQAYRTSFQQEAVLKETAFVCTAFIK